MDNTDIKAMLIGIAVFVGGMVTVILLMKYFQLDGMHASLPVQQNQRLPRLRPILEDIKEEIEMQVPAGEYFDKLVTVSDQIYEIRDQKDGLPWSSFSIENLGPSPIYMRVNNSRTPSAPIQVGRSMNIDFNQKGSIHKVSVVCDTGFSSTASFHVVI